MKKLKNTVGEQVCFDGMHMTIPYEQDFYGWIMEQVDLLQSGRLNELDLDHLVDEVVSIGVMVRSELQSRLELLLQLLLKWQFHSCHRSLHLKVAIKEQRHRIGRILRKNPTLKTELLELWEEAYDFARYGAARSMFFDIDDFPHSCPWQLEQAMLFDFYPD